MRPEHPSDPPRRSITLRNGAKVAYSEQGEGPAIVALHGCPGSVRDWRWLGPCLEPHTRLVRLELPGFGETPLKTFPDPTFPARADWVLDVLDALKIDTFVAMGHSAGGPLALELAARRPKRAKGLVLIASPGLRPHNTLREQPVPPRRVSAWLAVPGVRHFLTYALHKGFKEAGFPKVSDDSVHQSIHIISHLDFQRQLANLEALRAPSVVAWSHDDAFIEASVSRELAEASTPGPKLGFPDGGHYIQKTYAVEIGDAVLNMLNISR